MLPGGQPEREEERGQREPDPKPPGRLSDRPPVEERDENLPGQRQEEADPDEDRGADTHADVTRLAREQA